MHDDHPEASPSSTSSTPDATAFLRRRIHELESLLDAHGIAIPKDPASAHAPLHGILPPPIVVPPPKIPPIFVPETSSTPLPSEVERFVGVKLAAVAGALAVLGAIAYFIKYAIDTGLFGRLGPEAKFAASLAVAAIFLVAAERVRVRYSMDASRGLYGIGIVALFASVFGGVFMLRLFDAPVAALLVAGAGLVGAGCAVRSKSATVGVLSLLGGLALPAGNGFSEGSILSGIELTAVLLLATGLTSLGGMNFVRVRNFALLGGVPLSIAWGVLSNAGPVERALFPLVWWGILAGSCIFEALRGRHAKDNAITLAAASATALVGCVVATGGGSSLSDPLAYLPLLMGGGLSIAGIQLRAIGEPGDADEIAPDASDTLRDEVAVACRTLSSVAIGCAPFAVLAALGVFLDGAGVVVGAGGAAALLAFSTARLGRLALVPACVLATVVAFFGGMWQLLTAVTATIRPSVWAPLDLSLSRDMGDLLAVRYSSDFLAPLMVTVLLFLPLVCGIWPRVLALTIAGFATLLSVSVILCFLGPFPASLVFSLIAVALVVARTRSPRFADTGWHLLAFAYACFGLLCVWVALLWIAATTDRNALWLLQAVFLAAPHCALWSLRAALWEKAKGWFDAALALEVSALCTCVLLVRVYQASAPGDEIFARITWILSACSLAISTIAYQRRSLALGRAAIFAAALPAWIILTAAMFALFSPANRPWGIGNPWIYAACTPAVALFAGQLVLRQLGATPLVPTRTKGALHAFALAALIGGCIVWLGSISDGPMRATLLVSVLGVFAIGCLYWGFRRSVAGARWIGLLLLALLALRLVVVDLAQISAIVRVLLLFAAGLVLVGTSIAYALLRPKRASL